MAHSKRLCSVVCNVRDSFSRSSEGKTAAAVVSARLPGAPGATKAVKINGRHNEKGLRSLYLPIVH